jgi:cytoskeletal protein CcmA (bactofilin family)
MRKDTQVWNKRNDEPAAFKPPSEPIRPQGEPMRSPAPPPIAPAALASPPPPPPPVNGPKQSAVIGPSMAIKGEIRAREELLVDGDVEGLLESQSLLTVGPNGKVRGNIKAREVAIFGSVRGNVEVSEKIAIREQGSLIGDIKSAGISIDDGAYFKGSIDIVRPEPKATKAVQSGPRIGAHAG